jgi:hypothetical protein
MTAASLPALSRGFQSVIRNNAGISISADLKTQFPAVFSNTHSPKLSDEYQMYPSHQIIEVMDKAGMNLVEIRQQRSLKRDPSHQEHMLRFRPRTEGLIMDARVGDTVPELVWINAHNGRRRAVAAMGLFRLICSNGLVAFDAELGRLNTKHFGANAAFDMVRALIEEMGHRLPNLTNTIADWSAIDLSSKHQLQLAQAVMKGNEKAGILPVREFPSWVRPEMLIEARREVEGPDQSGSRDLWTTFNVIQENVMKGGMASRSESRGKDRDVSTREVTGAMANFELNRRLWEIAALAAESVRGPKAERATPVVEEAPKKVKAPKAPKAPKNQPVATPVPATTTQEEEDAAAAVPAFLKNEGAKLPPADKAELKRQRDREYQARKRAAKLANA